MARSSAADLPPAGLRPQPKRWNAKPWNEIVFRPSPHRSSRRRRLLADRARRRGRDPSRHRRGGRNRRCRCRRSRTRGHADRRFRHPHAEQQLARHRQADQRAVVSGAAADGSGNARRRAAHARRHRDRLSDDAQGGRRRTEAVRSSSEPSCGARLPASDRLRSREGRRRRSHGKSRSGDSGAARHSRSLCGPGADVD